MIGDDLAAAARDPACADRPALVHRGDAMSYAALWNRVEAAAAWFAERLPPGARVAIMLENSPELVIALYAASSAGLIAVPIDAAIHARNLEYVLADAAPEAIVSTARHLGRLPAGAPSLRIAVGEAPPGALRFDDLSATVTPPRLDPETPAVLSYTTGTTGLRKGVLLPHRALTAAVRNINAFTRLDGVVELVCMPLTHSFAFARLRCVFAVRGTAVLMSGLARPDDLFAALAEHRVDSIGLVPIACRMLIDHYRGRLAELGPQIRFVELGSDFLHRRYKEALLDLFPRARICMHYGLTEASRSAFIEFRSERDLLDTIGRPTPGVEVAVEGGEICVRGPTLMLGYWRKPELTAQTLRDGWLHTGDLGSCDEAGYLRLVGRRTDVFKVAGLGVAPQEIESVLAAHPDVTDAAVAARASSTTTAVELVAFVVARQGIDAAELRKHCRAQLESHKVPARIVLVDALPRTGSGKLQRQELDRLDPQAGEARSDKSAS